GFARPTRRAAGEPGARVHVAPLFSPRQTGARNSAGARQDSFARRLLEPESHREWRGARGKSRSHAWSLLAAGRGVEGVLFQAGTGRGGKWSRLLAHGDWH